MLDSPQLGLICPLVPGLGPASLRLPGQHILPQTDAAWFMSGGASTPPDTAATQSQASRHHLVISLNAMRSVCRLSWGGELYALWALRGQLKLKVSIRVAPP